MPRSRRALAIYEAAVQDLEDLGEQPSSSQPLNKDERKRLSAAKARLHEHDDEDEEPPDDDDQIIEEVISANSKKTTKSSNKSTQFTVLFTKLQNHFNETALTASEIIASHNRLEQTSSRPKHGPTRALAFQILVRRANNISIDEWIAGDATARADGIDKRFDRLGTILQSDGQSPKTLLDALPSLGQMQASGNGGRGLAMSALFKVLMARFALVWAGRAHAQEGDDPKMNKQSKTDISGANKILAAYLEWGTPVFLHAEWLWKTFYAPGYASPAEEGAHILYLQLLDPQYDAQQRTLQRRNMRTRHSLITLIEAFLGQKGRDLVVDSLNMLQAAAVAYYKVDEE